MLPPCHITVTNYGIINQKIIWYNGRNGSQQKTRIILIACTIHFKETAKYMLESKKMKIKLTTVEHKFDLKRNVSIPENKINTRINTHGHSFPLLTLFNCKRPKNTNQDDLT